jgi:hypothetical protein
LTGAALTFSSLTLFGIDLTAFYTMTGTSTHTVMPVNQAWLGLEIEFYLLAPSWHRGLRPPSPRNVYHWIQIPGCPADSGEILRNRVFGRESGSKYAKSTCQPYR